jgi:hypothetical protein
MPGGAEPWWWPWGAPIIAMGGGGMDMGIDMGIGIGIIGMVAADFKCGGGGA